MKVIRVIVGGLLGLVALAVLGAWLVLQGPRLGRLISKSLPENRGKIELGGVTWQLRALVDVITDAPSPIAVDGLRILDPEGTVVLDVPHLTARIRLRTIIKGSFSINDLRVPKATWRFAQMKSGTEIGFLAALDPKHPPPPSPRPKPDHPGPGTYFQIANAQLGDFDAIFDFPGTWGLELRHTQLTASLLQSTVDPLHPVFGFDAGPVVAQGGGMLRIFDDNRLFFDRIAINHVATTQEHPDDIFLDLAGADSGHSRLSGKGFFTGIYGATSVPGIDLHAQIADAGDLLGAAVAAKKIDGLSVGGSGASVRVDLEQPFEKIRVAAVFRGLDVDYTGYRAQGLGLELGFDGGAGRLDVKRLGFGAPGGGRLEADAALDTNKLALTLDARLRGFHTESYLPRGLRALAGGQISGQLQAWGDLKARSLTVSDVDLRLDRARGGSLPRSIRVHGAARLSPAAVETSGLVVDVSGANARLKGKLDLERQLVQASLSVLASDLGRLLGEMGLPPLAKSARAQLTLGGSVAQPTASGDAVIDGLGAEGRSLPELTAHFSLQNGAARIDSLAGAAFGGTLRASGELRLYEKTTRHMLRSPVVDLQIAGRNLDLAALAGTSAIGGRLSFDGQAHGPLEAVTAQLRIPAGTALEILGDDYQLGAVEIGVTADAIDLRRFYLVRKSGGALDVHGTLGARSRELDLDVVVSKLPLEKLPGMIDSPVPVSGLVSAKLHVSGTVDRPLLAGDIDLTGVSARGVKLGNGRLTLAPVASGAPGPEATRDRIDDKNHDRSRRPRKNARAKGAVAAGGAPAGAVKITGDLFERFHLDGTAALGPEGPSVHGAVTLQRVALEGLIPEIGALGEGRGLATGRITIDLDPRRPLALDVLLQELALSVSREVQGGNGETTVERVHVQAAKPIHAAIQGGKITLDEAVFSTDGGDFRAEGRIDVGAANGQGAVQGQMSGHLDLEILRPLLTQWLDRLSGDLKVELSAAGTLDRPLLHGRIDVVTPVKLRPKGFDGDITVGSGSFQLDKRGVQIEQVALTVDGSTVHLSGKASLGAGFQPENIQADVDGEVSARLLGYAAADAVSDTQGTARVHASIRGTMAKPEIHGRLDLGNIDLRVRDLGAEIQIQSGVVEISNDGAILHDVKVHLDDGGILIIGASGVRAGRVMFSSLVPFKPGKVDLPLHGERLTYRSPETFEIDDLAFDLDLQGDSDGGLALGGEVRLVSGRYLQDFKVQNLVLSPRVNESSVRPFYAGKPLLAGLRLDLGVRTVGDGFVVHNNLAPEIHVDVVLNIGGTLAAPVLAGDVRPTDGRFHFPAMRGDFDLIPDVNHVTFIATKSVADGDTPELELQAMNLLTDANGADHTVRIHIHGPLREAQIDLSTDDGLDRNQTALLLLTGRTSTDSQRFGTQSPTVGANINTAADVGDQLLRDTVASLMEPYINDNFERLTGLVLRPSVGPNGFDVLVSKNISRYLIFRAEALLGFQNQSHQTITLDLWLMDYFRLAGGLERLTLSSEQGVPETLPLNGNLELRWDFAIRR